MSQSFPKEVSERIIIPFFLILILATGFFLRIKGVSWGLPEDNFYHQSFHPDEIGKLNSIINTNPSIYKDYKKSWYYNKGTFCYYLWKGIFNFAQLINFVSIPSEFNKDQNSIRTIRKLYLLGRASIILISLGEILIIYLLSSSIGGRLAGLFSALLMAISPADVINAHYMKCDIPAISLLLLSLLCLQLALKNFKFHKIILAGMILGLATASKYTMSLGILPAFVLLIQIKNAVNFSINKFISILVLFFIGFFIGFLIGCPDLILNTQALIAGVKEQFRVQKTPMSDSIGRKWGYFDFIFRVLPIAMGFLPLLISGLSLILLWVKFPARKWLFLLFWIAPYLFLACKGWPLVRYALPLTPFFAMAIGIAFSLVLKEKRPLNPLGFVLIIFFIVITFTNLVMSLKYVKGMSEEDVRHFAARWIETQIPTRSKIAMIAPGLYFNPPLNDKKYEIIPLNPESPSFDLNETFYVILSDINYKNILRVPELNPPARDFYLTILQGDCFVRLAEFNFRENFIFNNGKYIDSPIDWLYPCPIIQFFIPNKMAIKNCFKERGKWDKNKEERYFILR